MGGNELESAENRRDRSERSVDPWIADTKDAAVRSKRLPSSAAITVASTARTPATARTLANAVTQTARQLRPKAGKNAPLGTFKKPSSSHELVDELSISIAPVVLGRGKHLFDGFEETVSLEHVGVRQSRFATHITYHVVH